MALKNELKKKAKKDLVDGRESIDVIADLEQAGLTAKEAETMVIEIEAKLYPEPR